MRRLLVLGAVAILAGCGSGPDPASVATDAAEGTTSAGGSADPSDPPTEGAVAVWTVGPATPTPDSSSFSALVTRLGCSGGKTGEVLEPEIALGPDDVTVTFTVAALPDGAYPCPGNDQVRYEVQLGEPLGNRALLDGACVSGEAASTSSCAGGAVRWRPHVGTSSTEAADVPPDLPAEAEVLGGLTVRLQVPSTIRTGETLETTLHIENRSGRSVTEPGCRLTNTRHALIPAGQPDAEVWTIVVTRCAADRTYAPGTVEDRTGPTFSASTKHGDPLPAGDYLAVWEVDGRRVEYPVEISDD